MKGLDCFLSSFSDLMEKGFFLVPRKIAYYCICPEEPKRKLGMILLALVFLCYHTEGPRKLGRRKIVCKRGEYLGNYSDLAAAAGVTRYFLKRVLSRLQTHGLITLEEVPEGICIRLKEYVHFLNNKKTGKKTDASAVDLDELFKGLTGPSEEALRIAGEVKIPPLY